MRIIETDADVAEGLAHIVRRDRRLRKVARIAGPVPLRRRDHGFEGLARVVVGQQFSVASASAIWSRFAAAFPGVRPAAILAAGDAELKATGLSMPKVRTLRAIAEAALAGLDFDHLATLPGEEAHARLTAIKGIGPWTADVYLLFSVGHADIFPAGDLALRHAVAEAFGLEPPMPLAELAEMAEMWSPWRGVAARLFWAYYRAVREKAAAPV